MELQLTTAEFTKDNQVFSNKYFGNFATPKKLNRSSKQLSHEDVEAIEAGEVTSQFISELAKKLPVFTYKTCITIHGNLPEIQRQYIGGYKNLIQNKNGSLEVRYSAIDNGLKKEIARYIAPYGWSKKEDSTRGIYFEKCNRTSNKAEALSILETFKQEVENFKVEGLLAKVYVNGYVYFGMYYIFFTICPLLIKRDAIGIASDIANVTEEQLKADEQARQEEENKRQQEAEAARLKREQDNQLRKQRDAEERQKLVSSGKFAIATNYDNKRIYVRVVCSSVKPTEYYFYYDNKFNNLKVIGSHTPEPLGEAKPSRLNKTMLKEEISKGNVLVSNNLKINQ